LKISSAPDRDNRCGLYERCEARRVAPTVHTGRAANQGDTVNRLSAIALLLASSCSAQDKGDLDLASQFGADDGKADAAKSTKLVDNLAPDAKVVGTFDPRVRVYGYIVEAKRGAKLRISLAATAGADSEDVAKDGPLDTIMQVYGPFESVKKPGALLVAHDDDGDSLVPAPIDFEVTDDARYLIAFSSWQDTGVGAYEVSLGCTGTDLQCSRPDWMRPCTAGTLYIQGGRVDNDTTWDTCDIVLLEPTTVAATKTLTVRPGVVVKGNFLGAPPFGNVRLIVDGTLQAAGTPEHPIAFTSLKDGWGGIALRGPSNSLSNAYVEKAATAIDVAGSTTLSDLVIEGRPSGNTVTVGVRAGQNTELSFTRSVVKGFSTGLVLGNSRHIEVSHAIVRGNGTGIMIEGQNAAQSCGNPPPAPQVWRDPVITQTDVVDNGDNGITIWGSDILVQVSRSNILRNGNHGLMVHGSMLHPMSFLRENNIHSNKNPNGWDVNTLHRNGTLDLSSNYWVDISDPELSANWRSQCSGQIAFTGFSPTPYSAGPRLDSLTEFVKRAAQP
jgi:hypothetical protein